MKATDIYAPQPLNAETVKKDFGGKVEGRIESISVKDYNDGRSIILALVDQEMGVPLNTTNARTLIAEWGNETDAWIGKDIMVTIHKTVYMGKPTDGLKVDPLKTKK